MASGYDSEHPIRGRGPLHRKDSLHCYANLRIGNQEAGPRMNRTEDWDIIWRWQWFRRALWQPYFRDPSHPEGRPARSVPIWTWALEQHEASRVLDCQCGMGLRTILLREAGFEMVGADANEIAVRHAAALGE